jgi:16S rRNA C1402 (ribose-2'-O) methylase RsmI
MFVNCENTVKTAQLLKRFGISLTVISPCAACKLAQNKGWLLDIKSLEAQVVEYKITAL